MRVDVYPEAVKDAFDAVKDDPSLAESRALFESGRLPVEMIQALSLSPKLLRAFAGFGDALYPGGLLPRALKEKVILLSSRDNACQFCTSSHIDIMRGLGIAADPLASLDAPDDDRERLALEYTKAAMRDSNRVSDTLFAELKTHFSDAEIVELTFLIGYINLLNLFNNCLQNSYNGDYEANT